MRRVASWIAAGLVLSFAPLAHAVSVEDVPNPRARGQWVSDMVDVVDEATEARLNRLIDAVEAEQGVEIAVVCVDSVDTPTPKDFATSLFNHWGIGKAGRDSGLLVLLVLGERRLEMETGYGLEPVLTDGWLKSMQERSMVPAFKRGDYGLGLEAGVRASIERLRNQPDGVAPSSDPPSSARPRSASARGVSRRNETPWMWIFLGGLGLAGAGGAGAYTYRRNRTCPHCELRMAMLSEEQDDAKLDPGQITEERIGSIDYEFYYCTKCDFSRLIPNTSWFSGYGRCGSCSYRTSSSTSRTLSHPTYISEGLKEITSTCSHCGHVSQRTVTIPRRVQSSSSSSGGSFGGGSFGGGSSGGSFGGGRSGGGGAGSSF